MKWHYRKSRTPTAVSMQSICARVHSQSGVYNTPTFNESKSNTTAVDRRQLYGNVVTTARRFDTRRKFVFNLGTISHSLVTQHVITTNRWLYSRTINYVPNNETNELRIARITRYNKVQTTPTQFVIYRTSAWNFRQVITAKLIWQFPNSSQTLPPSRAVLLDSITIQIP